MTAENILQAGRPVSVPFCHEANSRQRILVVEDDSTLQRFNTEGLTYSGYQMNAAEDGAAAPRMTKSSTQWFLPFGRRSSPRPQK
jgi:hypothetical protein